MRWNSWSRTVAGPWSSGGVIQFTLVVIIFQLSAIAWLLKGL